MPCLEKHGKFILKFSYHVLTFPQAYDVCLNIVCKQKWNTFVWLHLMHIRKFFPSTNFTSVNWFYEIFVWSFVFCQSVSYTSCIYHSSDHQKGNYYCWKVQVAVNFPLFLSWLSCIFYVVSFTNLSKFHSMQKVFKTHHHVLRKCWYLQKSISRSPETQQAKHLLDTMKIRQWSLLVLCLFSNAKKGTYIWFSAK